eukprot:CAMPEP_0115855460 /NCGR_PEP_ID=MMETSP0287-20121206/14552_1 /TAXON_ID=412157 /ORGANISM="Chrysochromulina rotalis, Strain UIO044" /LENGTH=439 /DNA_ID=CAMNT_0003309611 /DNA_START=4 /DNA_END=1323 /DNA_ORIENTATION=+
MSASKRLKTSEALLSTLDLDADRYVALLSKLVGEAEKLQNNPAQGLYPREDLASDHVLAALAPYTGSGGPLTVERVAFTEGRGNVIITYKGATDQSIAFVGSHMDVVPANPETWKRDPFKLTVEGDELHGRGTTDCLGHVALITELFTQLAIHKPKLQRTVTAVFIANEENGEVKDIGVDQLMTTGKLDRLKSGPIIWVDCADSQPCVGTAGSMWWTLKAVGKRFHSGLPDKGVNALELANTAVADLQECFYREFPARAEEKQWNFMIPSTMKPTQVKCAVGSVNQIPPWVEISGDVRLTPFYEVADVRAKIAERVAALNADPAMLRTFGPASKYEIADCKGSLEFTWGEGFMEGIACRLDSEGHRALLAATEKVLGVAKPYSIGGSLPLVRNMQRGGFDVQMTGFGLMSTYHADNEYCKLADMKKGFAILRDVIEGLE